MSLCLFCRWKGERTFKLEGSDHAPVYASLLEIPDTPQHSTPSLSARYNPMIHGLQQTLGKRDFLFSAWLPYSELTIFLCNFIMVLGIAFSLECTLLHYIYILKVERY